MEEILEAQKEESQAQPLPAKAPKGLKEAKIGNIALFIALLSVCLIPFVYFFIGIIGKHTIPNSNIYLSVFLTLFSLFCVPLLFYEKTLFGDLNLKKKNILALMPIILLLAFLVWGIISTIFAPDKQLALFDYPARAEGLFMYFGYGIIFMGAMLLKKENFKRLIIYSFLIIMAFFCVFWVIDYLFFSRAYSFMGFNFTFPWANSNHAGYMLTISSLLAGSLFVFEEKKKSIKILALIGFGLFVLCGYFNNTLGCQIATFVALIMLTIIALTKNLFNYEKLIVLWVVFAGVTLLDAFLIKALSLSRLNFFEGFKNVIKEFLLIAKDADSASSATAGTNRWALWKECFRNIASSPLVGIGINCQKIANPHISASRPHNEPLQFASTMGLPAGLFYLSSLVIMLVLVFKQIKKLNTPSLVCIMGAIGYFVSSLFGVSIPYTFSIYILFLGLGFGGINLNKEEPAPSKIKAPKIKNKFIRPSV